MANPNIVNVTTITANNKLLDLVVETETLLINNPASSGKVYKINWINAANKNTISNSVFTVNINDQDDIGGTNYPLISNAIIPSNTSLIVTDKSTSFYLLEDQSISVLANNAGNTVVSSSWEEISS